MPQNGQTERFARFVALACHDLRTPLATVHGFARTLHRGGTLADPELRYVDMIEAASAQMAELVDSLALVARIESGGYRPVVQATDTLDLARATQARVGPEKLDVRGSGALAAVDPGPTERALAALVECARRHGGVERVGFDVHAVDLRLAPISDAAAPVIVASELRDLGAAAARAYVEALGGSLELHGETLAVHLPAAR